MTTTTTTIGALDAAPESSPLVDARARGASSTMDARRARVDAALARALKIERPRDDHVTTTTTTTEAGIEPACVANTDVNNNTSGGGAHGGASRVIAVAMDARRALERGAARVFGSALMTKDDNQDDDGMDDLPRCARARELDRQHDVREMRYELRRAMIDDAETSADVNDELCERWNALTRDADDDNQDDDDDNQDDDDAPHSHPMALHDAFTAHVARCAEANEPKRSLVARMERRRVVEDADRARANEARRIDMAHVRARANEALAKREHKAKSVVRDARRATCDVVRGERDATRANALGAMDEAREDEALRRVDGAREDATRDRQTLIALELANVDDAREKRQRCESRAHVAAERLGRAAARAPTTARRATDAAKARNATRMERETRARTTRRAVKVMQEALYDAKRVYAAMEEYHARLDARLRLRTNDARERLRVARLHRATSRARDDDKNAALFAMKRARIVELARALEGVERDIWRKVLRAPGAPAPISNVVVELLTTPGADADADGWDHEALRRVLDERTRAWVRVERAQAHERRLELDDAR